MERVLPRRKGECIRFLADRTVRNRGKVHALLAPGGMICHMADMSSVAAIDVQGLVKRFGALTAVNGLDLKVEQGECFGLLGPNGAGKTTTVEILEGLQRADGGEVRLLGMRWEDQEDELRAVSYTHLTLPTIYSV